jgi:hypothetical protein
MRVLDKMIIDKYEGTIEEIINIHVSPKRVGYSADLYYITLTYGKFIIEQVMITVINDKIYSVNGKISIPMINEINNLIKEECLNE